jgi:uncharacterized membrane protein YdfJ with MMPL/SSD domain
VRRLTDLVLRRRRLLALAWLLLAVAGGWAASGLGDALSQSFDAPDRPASEANREIVERFGSGGVVAPIAAEEGPRARAALPGRRGGPRRPVPLASAAVSILRTFLPLRGLAAETDVSFVVQFLVGLIGLGVAIDYSCCSSCAGARSATGAPKDARPSAPRWTPPGARWR